MALEKQNATCFLDLRNLGNHAIGGVKRAFDMSSLKQQLCLQIRHGILEIEKPVLINGVRGLLIGGINQNAKKHTLSQSLIPFDSAVSASIKFSVSS